MNNSKKVVLLFLVFTSTVLEVINHIYCHTLVNQVNKSQFKKEFYLYKGKNISFLDDSIKYIYLICAFLIAVGVIAFLLKDYNLSMISMSSSAVINYVMFFGFYEVSCVLSIIAAILLTVATVVIYKSNLDYNDNQKLNFQT